MKIGIIMEDRFICNSIAVSIDWMKNGYELIGAATNVEEARTLIALGRPDLLIMDSTIAESDGEGEALTSFILQVLPGVRVIAVSPRGLVEPVSGADLQVIDVVQMTKDTIHLTHSLLQALQRHRCMYKLELKSRQLTSGLADYIIGAVSRLDELKRELEQACIEMDTHFVLFLLKPAVPSSIYPGEKYVEACRSKEAYFIRCCLQLEEEMPALLMIPLQIGELFAIVILAPDHPLDTQIKSVLNAIESTDRQTGQKSLHIYSSRVYYGLVHLRKAFTDVLFHSEKTFFASAYLPVEGRFNPAAPTGNDMPRWETIAKNPMDIVLLQDLPAILQNIALRSEGSVFTAKCQLVELCFSLKRYAAKLHVITEPSYPDTVEKVFRFANLEDAYVYVKQLFITIKEFPDLDGSTSSPIVKSVMTYLHAHYPENIGLAWLADHFNMNASYLSRLLSQETGTTFTDLLAHIRIYHAKVLLREGKLRGREVCEAVGYRDYSHFYMVFRKIEGLSPKEYVKQMHIVHNSQDNPI